MKWSAKLDPRPWEAQHTNGNRDGFIMEFVVKGDSINSWKEMFAQQISFTRATTRQFADAFKRGLVRSDPNIEMQETANLDGSITLSYTSISADETSIRRFIKGTDGIYMLAYHVRPKLKDGGLWQTWRAIVDEASLVPNPAKRR